MKYDFYKNNKTDQIWWIDNFDRIGEHLFSFDKEKIFNLFVDYPFNLTDEQKVLFDKENPFWKDFFIDRHEEWIFQKYKQVTGSDEPLGLIVPFGYPEGFEQYGSVTKVYEECIRQGITWEDLLDYHPPKDAII